MSSKIYFSDRAHLSSHFDHRDKASNMVKRWRNFLVLLLLFVLVAPNFPLWIGNEVYVNLFFVLISFLTLFVKGRTLKYYEIYLLVFFFILQALLLLSWSNDILLGRASFSDLLSLFRPIFLVMIPIAFLFFLKHTRRHPLHIMDAFFAAALIILMLYFVLDYGGFIDPVKRLLYTREKLFKYNYFLSFFATTYFAAYFYFTAFTYAIFRFMFGAGRRWLVYGCFAAIFIIMAQSKTFYANMVLVLGIAIFLRVNWWGRLLVLMVGLSSVFVLITFNALIADYLLTGGVRGIRSMAGLVNNAEEHGSLVVRLFQVVNAINLSMEQGGLGVGLGRGLMLESYLSSFIYRYGLLGFFLYNIFFLMVAAFSLRRYSRAVNWEDKVIFSFGGVWYLLLPISLLSSPMYEMGKGAVFSGAVLACILFAAKPCFSASGQLKG